MWRFLIICLCFLVFMYYVTLVLHMFNVVKMTNKLGFSAKYLIPFVLWFETK